MTKHQAVLFSTDTNFTVLTMIVNKNDTLQATIDRIMGFETISKDTKLGIMHYNEKTQAENNLAVAVQDLPLEGPITDRVKGPVLMVANGTTAFDKPVLKNIIGKCKSYLSERAKNSNKENVPKRPKKPYDFFCKQYHSQHKKPADFNPNETGQSWFSRINTASREAWGQLNDEDKQEFDQYAEDDKKRYQTELKEFKELNPSPPKKPSSAYNIYCKEYKIGVNQTNPDVVPWKSMEEESKKKYTDAALLDMTRYQNELEMFKTHCEKHNKNFNELIKRSKKSKKRSRQPADDNGESEAGVKTAKTSVYAEMGV
jgi:hypothetical protein